jgi:hypothetical protein
LAAGRRGTAGDLRGLLNRGHDAVRPAIRAPAPYRGTPALLDYVVAAQIPISWRFFAANSSPGSDLAAELVPRKRDLA